MACVECIMKYSLITWFHCPRLNKCMYRWSSYEASQIIQSLDSRTFYERSSLSYEEILPNFKKFWISKFSTNIIECISNTTLFILTQNFVEFGRIQGSKFPRKIKVSKPKFVDMLSVWKKVPHFWPLICTLK